MPGLILSRRAGEAIIINGNIRVAVASVSGGNVRLHIEAPKEIRVHREEIEQRMIAERDGVSP
jgi:carbon storage regulator